MTRKLRMTLLGMSSVAAMAAPVALAVSCGGDSDNGSIAFAPFAPRENVGTSAKITTTGEYKAQLILDGHDHSQDDKSFNQSVFEAINGVNGVGGIDKTNGVGTGGVIVKPAMTGNTPLVGKPSSPSAKSDFVNAYVATPEKTIMVMPGFMHIDPLVEYLKSNDAVSKNKYAILLDGDVANPRVASVNFQAHQAAFEAGVLAGFYLNENNARFGADSQLKVATFGGLDIPTVTGSMVGFQKGIEWFNANNDQMDAKYQKDIIFMDNGSKADYYSGGFAPGQANTIAGKLVTGGADLIFPVAGPQTADVAAAIRSNKSKAQIIGVDSAQELDSSFNLVAGQVGESLVAFSALKDLKVATTKVLEVITGVHNKNQDGYHGIEGLGGQTLGNLDNGLVGVSHPTNVPNEIYVLATSDKVKEAALALDNTAKFNW